MKDLKPILDPPDLILRYRDDPEAVAKKYPKSSQLIRPLFNLYQKIRHLSQAQAKKVITESLSYDVGKRIEKGRIYEEFTRAISAAKDFRQSIIREFVPDALRFPFTSDGVVNPIVDPVILLRMMWEPPGDPRYATRRSFLANVFWNLGLRYFVMRLENTYPEKHLSDLTLWFERELFITANATEDQHYLETALISYDPDNANRYVESLPLTVSQTGQNCLNLMLGYRFIKVGNRVVRCLYDSRVKQEADIFRKVLSKSQAEKPVAHDTCAISFVFFSEEDLRVGFEALTDRIFTNSAMIYNLRHRSRHGKSHNDFTGGDAPPELQFLVYALGGIIEVQIFLFPNYFNRRFSLGDENHHLYRTRQIQPILNCLFPTELYLDWNDQTIQKMLKEMQLQKIRTNFEGFVLPQL
jgi:hypothetical protein